MERRLQAPAFGERIGFARLAREPVPRCSKIGRQRERIDDAHGERGSFAGTRRKGGMDRHRREVSSEALRWRGDSTKPLPQGWEKKAISRTASPETSPTCNLARYAVSVRVAPTGARRITVTIPAVLLTPTPPASDG